MSDGHFWHDFIDGVVIWESDAVAPEGTGPSAPIEAQPDDLHHAPHDDAAAPHHDAEWIEGAPAEHPIADVGVHDDTGA